MILSWDTRMSTEETNSVAHQLALVQLARISNPEMQGELRKLLVSRDYASLIAFRTPHECVSPADAYAIAQVISLFKKRIDLDLGLDRDAVALAKFGSSERSCRETNERFRLWASGGFQFHRSVEHVLFRAQQKIARCLGDVPDLSQLRLRFGPGSTTQVKKVDASARRKLSQRIACSEDLLSILTRVLEEVPRWAFSDPDGPADTEIVTVELHHGKLSFVPKDATTSRSIVVEPALNSFVQAGIGDFIARRLMRLGVDITDQSRNQELARLGSVNGELATLDLSSASDTVATELVAHLLPLDWFLFLTACRTSHVDIGTETIKLQKFSSMGNGFTFPLETLIFWALSSASTELHAPGGTVSVYGDDIIVPTGAVALTTCVLDACGFAVNLTKSFWSGPFRESCGKDYHSGINIRPVYLKDRLDGETAMIMHNFFVRRGDSQSAELLYSLLSEELQIFGPDGYGDGHLIGDHSAFVKRLPAHADLGYGGFVFETIINKPCFSFARFEFDHRLPSYTIYAREPFALDADGDQYPLQDSVPSIRYKKGSEQWGVQTPGSLGHKRIKIYTFES